VADRVLLLGVDLGSSATKAVLLEPGRGVVASSSRPVELHSPHPGWAEADPGDWWRNLTELVPDLLTQAGSGPTAIAAVAVAGMVPAVVCIDGDGRPLGRAMLQNDARAVTQISAMADELVDADLLERTGSELSQQSVGPSLRWLAEHEPEVWSRTRHVLGSYDWLAVALGALPHVERNWAIESGMFALDLTPVTDVLESSGAGADVLPRVAIPGSVVGNVSEEAALATGLVAGTPIVVGGADHVMSAFGAGLFAPGDWLIKLGGAGDVLAVTEGTFLDSRLYLDAHPQDGLWLPNGCMATSGSLLRWLQQILGGVDLLTLDAEAADVEPASLLCLPYFLGEKSPLHDPDARGAFVGLHLGTTRGGLHRASLEAIAYGFRQHVDIFAERGVVLGDPRVTNGGSSSVLWKHILADVLERPLVPVIDHPGASLGAAVAAGLGVGAFQSWDVMRDFVRLGTPIEPDPSTSNRYEEGYRMYCDLEPALRPFSHALARRGRS
jgi:xylulokinase